MTELIGTKERLRSDRPARLCAGSAALLLVASITQPVAVISGPPLPSSIGGGEIAYMGAFAPLAGQFGWYANPLAIIAIVAAWRGRSVRILRDGLLGVGMALLLLNALAWSDYPNDCCSRTVLVHLAGFYLWSGAIVAAIMSIVVRFCSTAD